MTGRTTTSANAKKSDLVLNGSSSLRELVRITQGVACISSQAALDEAGRTLIGLAQHAWLSRQVDVLGRVVQAILALPLSPQFHAVARYYTALSEKTTHNGQTGLLLESLADIASAQYKPRIIIRLAAYHLCSSDLNQAAKTYVEAARASKGTDLFGQCSAIRGLALIRSLKGDHQGSLGDLERLFPVMRSFATSYPEDYRYYLNNLAYELGQVGRIEEARAAINVALRSPYADRFPDWAETAQEIETMRRRVFLPLVFALGLPAALGPEAGLSVKASDEAARNLNVPSVTESAAVAARARQQVEAEALAQPESQPDIQTSPARVVAPTHRRNLKTSFLIVLARVTCRRVAQEAPLRETLKPTFQTSGCAQSPSARAPPIL